MAWIKTSNGNTTREKPNQRFLQLKDQNNSLLIVDYDYWNANEEELAKWLHDNTERGLYTREGMILYFTTEQEMSWFLLKWN